jgi:DNA-directed RNA polymerase I subunit RPA43
MPEHASIRPTKDRSKHKSKEKSRKRKRHGSPSSELPVPSKEKKARMDIVKTIPKDKSNVPYRITTTSLYLSLPPKYSFYPAKVFPHRLRNASNEALAHLRSLNPITGVQRHHLDPLLMTYYEPVDGVVIGYDNVRFETETAKIIAEAPWAHVWTTVDLLVWRPKKGMVLQGWVNLQSASHIGLLVDNTWNVSIPFARIPESWEYHEGTAAPTSWEEGMEVDETESAPEGAWVDDKGYKVNGLLRFQVESVKAGGSIFLMEGSLLDRETIDNAKVPKLGA